MAGVLQKTCQNELHGGVAAKKAMPCEPHFSHPAAPQEFLQMVAAEILRTAQILVQLVNSRADEGRPSGNEDRAQRIAEQPVPRQRGVAENLCGKEVRYGNDGSGGDGRRDAFPGLVRDDDHADGEPGRDQPSNRELANRATARRSP